MHINSEIATANLAFGVMPINGAAQNRAITEVAVEIIKLNAGWLSLAGFCGQSFQWGRAVGCL
jgi:hypothetical protein